MDIWFLNRPANTVGAVTFDLLSFEFDPTESGDFIGSWDGDTKSGHGMEQHALGSYHGEYAEGHRHGLVTPLPSPLSRGDIFYTRLTMCLLSRMGEFVWADGASGPAMMYKGFWAEGQMDGLGAMTFENGDRFFGVWKMGHKAGEGFYLEADEMDQTIEATDGKVQLKQAICIYDDGSSYTGQIWAPFKVSGKVTETRRSAEIVDPVETVDGDCHWVPGTDGSKFEFVKPHGKGVLEYANGERYAGGWEAGRPHGQGMLIGRDGAVSYGTWNRGQQV